MMELWYEDMVRFMRDASEYGSYNQSLAKRLAPALNREMTVCDAGCGLGYLSLELAKLAGQVVSVDKNPSALAVLEENCRSRGIQNIAPRLGDVRQVPPEKAYDAMVFCFFGSIDEILTTAKAQCRGQVFIITRTYTHHRFSVGTHPTGKYGYQNTLQTLEQLDIPFEEETFNLEFGQPFRSFDDARKFYETYSHDEDKSAITDSFLWSKLVKTGDACFPLYMPHRRSLALLKFHTKDIPTSMT